MTTGRTKRSPKPKTAEGWIQQLGLKPHPEGGFYRETYRSSEKVKGAHLPRRFKGARCLSTSIYFLLKTGQVSRFHRILADEIWHFYRGDPVRIHFLFQNGSYAYQDLGVSEAAGAFQAVIPAGVWFGAEIHPGGRFALMGCTVAPGFDFKDFCLAGRKQLLKKYPDFKSTILRLTRETL